MLFRWPSLVWLLGLALVWTLGALAHRLRPAAVAPRGNTIVCEGTTCVVMASAFASPPHVVTPPSGSN